eukprot:842053-Pyramimonas_sp.AAC.1
MRHSSFLSLKLPTGNTAGFTGLSPLREAQISPVPPRCVAVGTQLPWATTNAPQVAGGWQDFGSFDRLPPLAVPEDPARLGLRPLLHGQLARDVSLARLRWGLATYEHDPVGLLERHLLWVGVVHIAFVVPHLGI